MPRLIDIKPDKPAELAPSGTSRAIIEAFNTGLIVLERPNLFPGSSRKLTTTQRSLTDLGLDSRGLKDGQLAQGLVSHRFSRTGEKLQFIMGVFTAGVIEALETDAKSEATKLDNLLQRDAHRFPTNLSAINGHTTLERTLEAQAELLKKYSTPFTDMYDVTSLHPDIQAIVEYYAWMTHSNRSLDSAVEPSLAHNEADWSHTIRMLQNESILRLPVEASMTVAEKGRSRWGKIWPLGCISVPFIAGGAALMLAVCDDQNRSTEALPSVPPVVATVAAQGQPPIGIIPPIFVPKPEANISAPEAATTSPITELTPEPAECDSGMDITIIEIKREGDSDANRIYRYPNRVNPAGDSAKGLFDKELVNSYVKDNPYSDPAIRYSLRNQTNEGRGVPPSDQDLLVLLDEARLFYGQPVTDAAFLAWMDSIRRNNPSGTIVGDLINADQFKSQSPESILKRLQAIQQP
jgi:hypothetical protein